MSHFQLIALDMDGTLLDSRKRLPEANRDAAARAADAGKTVVLCTGRAVSELAAYLPLLPSVRYVICVSGAVLYDALTGTVMEDTPLAAGVPEAIFDAVRGRDIMKHMLGTGSWAGRAQAMNMEHYLMGEFQATFVPPTVTYLDDLERSWRAAPWPVHKLNLYHTSAAERELSRTVLSGLDLPAALADSERASLECTARGVTKGTALLALCARLGIDPADTVAVGDGGNDLPAFAAAGLAVAMGNAPAEVRAQCDAVTEDCDHAGAAAAIDRYLLC